MIRAGDHDTAEPRNMCDRELTCDMTRLPPSRTLSDETPMACLIAKCQILRALGDVLDFLGFLRADTYDVAMNLEEELSRARSQVPPHLLLSGRTNSADDHQSQISKRVQLEYLYRQGICMIHRRFLAQGRRGSPRF